MVTEMETPRSHPTRDVVHTPLSPYDVHISPRASLRGSTPLFCSSQCKRELIGPSSV